MQEKYPIRNPDTAFSTVDGEAVIIDLSNRLINITNKVGTRIWELADGFFSLSEIIASIYSEFDVEQKQAYEDVTEFIFDLVDKELMLLCDTSTGEDEYEKSNKKPYEKPKIIYRGKIDSPKVAFRECDKQIIVRCRQMIETDSGNCSGGN